MPQEIQAKRRRCGILLLLLLLWVAVFTLLTHLFPVSYIFTFFQPFTFFESFLLQFTPYATILIYLLAALPLSGWILLRFDKRPGRSMILIPQVIVLAADAIVTPLHLFNEMGYFNAVGGRQAQNLGTTALLGLCGAIYPIAALILLSKWKPKIQ